MYRDFAGEGSRLFHYLLSFPLRIIELFTDNIFVQVGILRLINVIFGAVGLYYFFKLFDELKFSRSISNLSIAILISIPVVPWVAGAINYDNFIFMLTPVFMLIFAKLIKSKTINWALVTTLMLIGMVASLAKFTFLVVFAGALIILAITAFYRKDYLKVPSRINIKSFKHIALAVFVTIACVMFVQTYIVNVIQYGTPRPSCQTTLGTERCLANSVVRANERQKGSLDERSMNGPVVYLFRWLDGMINSSSFSASQPDRSIPASVKAPLPVVQISILLIFIAVIVCIVRYGKISLKSVASLVALVSLIYIFTVLINGYLLYEKYHAFRAIQFRYMLPQVLILIAYAIYLFVQNNQRRLVEHASTFIITAYLFLILVFIQGGGIITHIMRAEPNWYKVEQIRQINVNMRDILEPIVKEFY